VGLVLGDVCDHGVGSALYMVLFRSLMRTHAESTFHEGPGSSASTIMESMRSTISRTNDFITRTHGMTGMFATLFWAVLDPQNGHLLYINGGHIAPVLIGSDREPEFLHRTAPAVGVTEGAQFPVKEAWMRPGSVFLGFTDGVLDAQSPEGERYGSERLHAILTERPRSAEGLVQRILRSISAHTLGGEAYDDLTLLVLRRLEPAPRTEALREPVSHRSDGRKTV
jgi:serine phosphatase RsbU (regulator of sigma subunit)